MIVVSMCAWGPGDGYLFADTQQWIDDRGEYAADLTEDLREWMDANGHTWPEEEALIGWITERTGKPPAGPHGDGALWRHDLVNFADHLIDDFGFVVLSAVQFGDLMITVSDHARCYVDPTVYGWTVDAMEEWADYSHAEGECANGHRWYTRDSVTLRSDEDPERTRYHVHLTCVCPSTIALGPMWPVQRAARLSG